MVVTIEPHGFCPGVRSALKKAEEALSEKDGVCALHALVHNSRVTEALAAHGLRVVPGLDAIPPGSRLLVSAHGTAPSVVAEAEVRGIPVLDATCPFVARVHREVAALSARGANIVVIGHAGHVEVTGVLGEARDPARIRAILSTEEVKSLPFPDGEPVGVVCQTTLSRDSCVPVLAALKARYPHLETPASSEVCSATRERQEAVRAFVRNALAAAPSQPVGVLVLGSAESSNTSRLVEIAAAEGAKAWRAEGAEELDSLRSAISGTVGSGTLGITAGASTPESVVTEVLARFQVPEGGG